MVELAEDFVVKDSGAREEFDSGMRRDTQDGKIRWLLIRTGPMLARWAKHLTSGAEKYGDDNWTLASGEAELRRFKESAARHFEQWLAGDRDEDHGAAVFFNINGAEYVLDRMRPPPGEAYVVDNGRVVLRITGLFTHPGRGD